MLVNRYTIRKPHLSGTTGLCLNVPISAAPWLADQEDIINTKFVDIEVKASINEIVDFESTRFLPKMSDDTISKGVTYRLNYLSGATYNSPTFWKQLEFEPDDLNFRKNNFTKSFLRLDFYDNDIGTSQRLISFVTLFPKFHSTDLKPNGQAPDPSVYPVQFALGDSYVDKTISGEGFALYYFKDAVIPTVPKYLYMRPTFLNAKNGKTLSFMSSSDPDNGIDTLARTTIDTNLTNQLYTRYILKREEDGFCYQIDKDYSNNITESNGNYIVDLYEISSL